jgi:phenylpyruvate tautomerase PptA (4-oxalocrotonate tautomerase family)
MEFLAFRADTNPSITVIIESTSEEDWLMAVVGAVGVKTAGSDQPILVWGEL